MNVSRHTLQLTSKSGISVGYSQERKTYRIYNFEEVKIHKISNVKLN